MKIYIINNYTHNIQLSSWIFFRFWIINKFAIVYFSRKTIDYSLHLRLQRTTHKEERSIRQHFIAIPCRESWKKFLWTMHVLHGFSDATSLLLKITDVTNAHLCVSDRLHFSSPVSGSRKKPVRSRRCRNTTLIRLPHIFQ